MFLKALSLTNIDENFRVLYMGEEQETTEKKADLEKVLDGISDGRIVDSEQIGVIPEEECEAAISGTSALAVSCEEEAPKSVDISEPTPEVVEEAVPDDIPEPEDNFLYSWVEHNFPGSLTGLPTLKIYDRRRTVVRILKQAKATPPHEKLDSGMDYPSKWVVDPNDLGLQQRMREALQRSEHFWLNPEIEAPKEASKPFTDPFSRPKSEAYPVIQEDEERSLVNIVNDVRIAHCQPTTRDVRKETTKKIKDDKRYKGVVFNRGTVRKTPVAKGPKNVRKAWEITEEILYADELEKPAPKKKEEPKPVDENVIEYTNVLSLSKIVSAAFMKKRGLTEPPHKDKFRDYLRKVKALKDAKDHLEIKPSGQCSVNGAEHIAPLWKMVWDVIPVEGDEPKYSPPPVFRSKNEKRKPAAEKPFVPEPPADAEPVVPEPVEPHKYTPSTFQQIIKERWESITEMDIGENTIRKFAIKWLKEKGIKTKLRHQGPRLYPNTEKDEEKITENVGQKIQAIFNSPVEYIQREMPDRFEDIARGPANVRARGMIASAIEAGVFPRTKSLERALKFNVEGNERVGKAFLAHVDEKYDSDGLKKDEYIPKSLNEMINEGWKSIAGKELSYKCLTNFSGDLRKKKGVKTRVATKGKKLIPNNQKDEEKVAAEVENHLRAIFNAPVEYIQRQIPGAFSSIKENARPVRARGMIASAAEAGVFPRARSLKRALKFNVEENKKVRKAFLAYVDKNYHPDGSKRDAIEEYAPKFLNEIIAESWKAKMGEELSKISGVNFGKEFRKAKGIKPKVKPYKKGVVTQSKDDEETVRGEVDKLILAIFNSPVEYLKRERPVMFKGMNKGPASRRAGAMVKYATAERVFPRAKNLEKALKFNVEENEKVGDALLAHVDANYEVDGSEKELYEPAFLNKLIEQRWGEMSENTISRNTLADLAEEFGAAKRIKSRIKPYRRGFITESQEDEDAVIEELDERIAEMLSKPVEYLKKNRPSMFENMQRGSASSKARAMVEYAFGEKVFPCRSLTKALETDVVKNAEAGERLLAVIDEHYDSDGNVKEVEDLYEPIHLNALVQQRWKELAGDSISGIYASSLAKEFRKDKKIKSATKPYRRGFITKTADDEETAKGQIDDKINEILSKPLEYLKKERPNMFDGLSKSGAVNRAKAMVEYAFGEKAFPCRSLEKALETNVVENAGVGKKLLEAIDEHYEEDGSVKEVEDVPEPETIRGLAALLKQEADAMDGVKLSTGYAQNLATKWKNDDDFSPFMERKGAKSFIKTDEESQKGAKLAAKKRVYNRRTDLQTIRDYLETDFPVLLKDCESAEERQVALDAFEEELYENGVVEEAELPFNGSRRHLCTSDEPAYEDAKKRIDDYLWENYLKDMPAEEPVAASEPVVRKPRSKAAAKPQAMPADELADLLGDEDPEEDPEEEAEPEDDDTPKMGRRAVFTYALREAYGILSPSVSRITDAVNRHGNKSAFSNHFNEHGMAVGEAKMEKAKAAAVAILKNKPEKNLYEIGAEVMKNVEGMRLLPAERQVYEMMSMLDIKGQLRKKDLIDDAGYVVGTDKLKRAFKIIKQACYPGESAKPKEKQPEKGLYDIVSESLIQARELKRKPNKKVVNKAINALEENSDVFIYLEERDGKYIAVGSENIQNAAESVLESMIEPEDEQKYEGTSAFVPRKPGEPLVVGGVVLPDLGEKTSELEGSGKIQIPPGTSAEKGKALKAGVSKEVIMYTDDFTASTMSRVYQERGTEIGKLNKIFKHFPPERYKWCLDCLSGFGFRSEDPIFVMCRTKEEKGMVYLMDQIEKAGNRRR